MSLLDSQEAIGAVTELLRTRVSMRLNNLAVVVGRPEAATSSTGRKLNLFLYRIGFDGYLRNIALDPGQEPPLWLVLHYLVTAFDENKESDSADAHRLLGRGLAALQELNFLRPNVAQLVKNPEPLKITFDEADVELLSKIMQGTDEKYRISAAFQVRPVMVMADQPASYAPLVKTVGPPLPNPPPYDQAGVQVLPNLGPRLASVLPVRFTAPASLTLTGHDLGGVDQVLVGPVALAATTSPEGDVTATVPATVALSAGSYPVTVTRPLDSGHRISSDAVLVHLLPKLNSATPSGLTPVSGTDPRLFGTLTLAGERLGTADDSVFVAFYGNGALQLTLEAQGSPAQTSLTVNVLTAKALDPGTYLIIVRVNGEQADDTPSVNWS
jgi:hypothetical protein